MCWVSSFHEGVHSSQFAEPVQKVLAAGNVSFRGAYNNLKAHRLPRFRASAGVCQVHSAVQPWPHVLEATFIETPPPEIYAWGIEGRQGEQDMAKTPPRARRSRSPSSQTRWPNNARAAGGTSSVDRTMEDQPTPEVDEVSFHATVEASGHVCLQSSARQLV